MPADSSLLLRQVTLASALTLLQLGVAKAQATPPPQPRTETHDAKPLAKARYEQGVEAYNAGQFANAVEHFLAADRLVPSAALSFNVARAYEQLAQPALALRYYRDYLRRETVPANTNTEAARARVAALEEVLMARGQQQLTVLSEPEGATLTVDGSFVGATPCTFELAPGAHQLALSKIGYQSAERAIELPATRASELRFTLPALSSAPVAPRPISASPVPTAAPSAQPGPSSFGAWPWITLGAGGVSLLCAGAFELSRRSAESDAETPELPQIAVRERIDAMHARQTTARALAVVGGALSVTGGLLVLLDPARAQSKRSTAVLACDSHSCLGSFAVQY
jgi:tetratricopeptide (TPR) repeat protein